MIVKVILLDEKEVVIIGEGGRGLYRSSEPEKIQMAKHLLRPGETNAYFAARWDKGKVLITKQVRGYSF